MFPLAGCRLFIEPLIDFDRTMDVTYGLLDRLCNPRPAFHALRVLNSVLATTVESHRPVDSHSVQDDTGSVHILRAGNARLVLILTNSCSNVALLQQTLSHSLAGSSSVKAYELLQGTVVDMTIPAAIQLAGEVAADPFSAPRLLVATPS